MDCGDGDILKLAMVVVAKLGGYSKIKNKK